MKKMLGVIAVSGLVFSMTIMAAEPALKSKKDKLSYTLGVQIGQDFKQRGIELNPDAFISAIKEIMAGKEPRLERNDMVEALQLLQQEQVNKMKQASSANLKKGEDFLNKNKGKKGVIELPSGVQYKVEKKGSGKRPTLNNSVVAHYRGTLIDGKEFDSSYSRGNPATFPVSGVIKGWQEVLQLMQVGAKWQVYIPASLGYGERGAGPNIGPNETLVFDIELIDIK